VISAQDMILVGSLKMRLFQYLCQKKKGETISGRYNPGA
jgi:hypothetical protein